VRSHDALIVLNAFDRKTGVVGHHIPHTRLKHHTVMLPQMPTKRRLALTGYPLQNDAMDLFYLLQWVCPALNLGTAREFDQNYATPIRNGVEPLATNDDMTKAAEALRDMQQVVQGAVHRSVLVSTCLNASH
jgi:hypothetical protein